MYGRFGSTYAKGLAARVLGGSEPIVLIAEIRSIQREGRLPDIRFRRPEVGRAQKTPFA